MVDCTLISIVDDDVLAMPSKRFLQQPISWPHVSCLKQPASLLTSTCLKGPALLGYAIPTILVTAYPDEMVRGQAMKDGVACYLSKPLDDEELERCLRSALKRGTSKKAKFIILGGPPVR
jgi:CheY-like chemotaxis protein